MHIAYKSQKLESTAIEKTTIKQKPPADKRVSAKKVEGKSIYTLMREERFIKAALKKYANRISAIQKVFPDWKLDI